MNLAIFLLGNLWALRRTATNNFTIFLNILRKIDEPQMINKSELIENTRDDSFYLSMLRIRRFEEKVLAEFSSGNFRGTTHTYLGQEANAVGVLEELDRNDIVVSNHRSHGHFLAYGGDMRALFAELMGKSTGICGGRGGSQHLHWKNFYSNGVLGGTSPIATGIALAEKTLNSNTVTVLFLGDGALGEGVVYESLNMAALWSIPILFVIENNHIAQTTPIDQNFSGDITKRFEAFNISTQLIDSCDVIKINNVAKQLVQMIRGESKPHAIVIITHRFGPHSKGDDTRAEEYISELRLLRDPITTHAGRLTAEKLAEFEREVNLEINESYELAVADPI
jgi:TPP-dependent pyruvate/acetoin dehydrogenase alpha subunit